MDELSSEEMVVKICKQLKAVASDDSVTSEELDAALREAFNELEDWKERHSKL